jgi:hypothetical protein
LAQYWNIEIQNQAGTNSGQAQIGQQLGFVDRKNPVNGFQFHNHLAFNHNVQAVAAVQVYPFVNDRQGLLTGEGDSPEMQFVAQAFFVGGFKQSRAQHTMDLDRCANDLLGQQIVFHG